MTSATDVFSVVIFFIALREAMEASLVIGTLMGMLESLARDILPDAPSSTSTMTTTTNAGMTGASDLEEEAKERIDERRALIKQLRKTILLGAASGLTIALCIGAVFLAVFYTQANNLYAKADEAWEGAFDLIAMLLITPMALALLRADRSRAKWRVKLATAFASKRVQEDSDMLAALPLGQQPSTPASGGETSTTRKQEKPDHLPSHGDTPVAELKQSDSSCSGLAATIPRRSTVGRFMAVIKSPFSKQNRGRTTIFTIPFVTTLREGLEGVVFIGGVSLGLPATSIPLPAIVGIALGLSLGFVIFKSGGFAKIRYFLLVSTCVLLLIAAGMASRAVYGIQFFIYSRKVGDAAAESGSGPGSYDANNYIWHIDCCSPQDLSGGNGWGVLNSLVGWNNTATYGSVLIYIAYWLVVIAYLLYSFWTEGRLALAYRWKGKRTALWESKKCIAKRQRTRAV